MKKKFFVILSFVLVFAFISFITFPIAEAYSFEENMLVTENELRQIDQNGLTPYLSANIDESNTTSGTENSYQTDVKVKLFGFIPLRTFKVNVLTNPKVTVGGNLLGFDLKASGVAILGFNSVLTENGEKNPIKDAGLQPNDIILKINDKEINEIDDINKIINGEEKGEIVTVDYLRGDKTFTTEVQPEKDLISKKYKLGLWVKNSSNGVGTLTYVRDDGRFGAVGHSITGEDIRLKKMQSGDVYNASLMGIKKGTKNAPGELKARINWSEKSIGTVDTNCNYGIFGELKGNTIADREMELGGRLSIKPGKAYIRTEIEEGKIKEYEISIIKTIRQRIASDKSIVFKVVDKELLESTGGIIQGMSGSPIIQDKKIVGSVTHVFLNDPTRGYGVYIDWMLDFTD